MTEDASLELLKIEDIILIKKGKQLLRDLRNNSSRGELILDNLLYLQIYSGNATSCINQVPF